jgi:hypothetical protein
MLGEEQGEVRNEWEVNHVEAENILVPAGA